MAKVPNGVETLPKISIVWVRCTNVTDDRQTTDDRRTDDDIYSEHEHEFTFAKNGDTVTTYKLQLPSKLPNSSTIATNMRTKEKQLENRERKREGTSKVPGQLQDTMPSATFGIPIQCLSQRPLLLLHWLQYSHHTSCLQLRLLTLHSSHTPCTQHHHHAPAASTLNSSHAYSNVFHVHSAVVRETIVASNYGQLVNAWILETGISFVENR